MRRVLVVLQFWVVFSVVGWVVQGPGRTAYCSVVRAAANVVAYPVGGRFRNHFEQACPDEEGRSPDADTAIVYETRGHRATKLVSLGQVGLLPSAMYLALIAAGWAVGIGSARSALVGFVVVESYAGLRLLAVVLYGWSELGQRFSLGGDSVVWEEGTSTFLRSVVNVDRVSGMFFFVPFLCWIWSAGLGVRFQAALNACATRDMGNTLDRAHR